LWVGFSWLRIYLEVSACEHGPSNSESGRVSKARVLHWGKLTTYIYVCSKHIILIVTPTFICTWFSEHKNSFLQH
jgi:hypothetical protein